MRPSSLLLGASVFALAVAQGGCDTKGFGKPYSGLRLVVELRSAPRGPIVDQRADNSAVLGSTLTPLDLSVDAPQPFHVVVRALDQNGNTDARFNGYVRISAKPGAIEPIAAPDADGRNIKLTNGESPDFEVKLSNAYGTTYIVADDLGYAPADPLAKPPPVCANGRDDDGDGTIDFPADEGCAFANDNSEGGGTYEQGASVPIFYRLPRVADVRGLTCVSSATPGEAPSCSGSGKTPYPKEQLFLDTGYHQKRDPADGARYSEFDFDMVVTRIASDGFYVSDVKDTRGGFNGIFAFNFNAPPRMRVCDRLKTFAGTATEFFGLTQISYPTWTLEEWDPQKRPCGVPEPTVFGPADVSHVDPNTGNLAVPTTLLPLTGSLVRALSADGVSVMVTPKFGPGPMPCVDETGKPLPTQECIDNPKSTFIPKVDAGTDCDLIADGRIDFTAGSAEERCSRTCSLDAECTEYSNFAARSTFRLTIKDQNVAGAIQADATTSAEFKPLEMKGKPLKAFTGTLHFFSGGSQYTIEARCKDDIVVDLNAQPLPSDKACVFPRTVVDENPQ